jgi:curved DNA-binding protein
MPVQFKDYYETLGVSKAAAQDEIRKAFRKLARQHHPDVSKDKKTAEAKFKEINEAYEVLGDPEKRKKYDTLGADWERGGAAQPPPGWQRGAGGGMGGEEFHFGGTGFSDFFEQFFGGAQGRQNPFGGFSGGMGREEVEPKGRDIEADILVTIEEALQGSRRKISFQRSSGGKVETYNVRIPAGVTEGQQIRLAGQGNPGPRGGKAGDLFLRVKFAQHPEFRVEGSDLVHEQALAPWQAVLGGEVSVPTPEGRARLKIPAGTQNGQRFRLKLHGLMQPSKTRGDLYVVVQIEMPKSPSPRERELWQQLAAESQKA